MLEPTTRVWILTWEDRNFTGYIPVRIVEMLAMDRRKLRDQKFQLIPEGGEPLTIKDVLVELAA